VNITFMLASNFEGVVVIKVNESISM